MRIKNWEKFQHFKDRRPPWIKLYRDLLDDPDWFDLDAKLAKNLVMIWLIASEDHGNLPSVKKLSFRLRISENATIQLLNDLQKWLIQDDINTISTRYQDDAPETETETETETERIISKPDGFSEFWSAYPKKIGKGAAEKSWKKMKPPLDVVLRSIEIAADSDQWRKDGGQYIPNPATWLNQKRWEDETEEQPQKLAGGGTYYPGIGIVL